MSLYLDIYREPNGGIPETIIIVPSSAVEEHDQRPFFRNVGEDELVSASLRGTDQILRCAFELFVGNDPDIVAKLKTQGIRENTQQLRDFEYKIHGELEKDFKLFQGTFGKSFLKLDLIKDENGEKIHKTVFSTPVTVLASEKRNKVMEATICELAKIAPQTIRSEVEGQNESILNRDWSHGAASMSSPKIEFQEIKKLVNRLCPLILEMFRSPAYSISNEKRIEDVECVHRWTPASSRQYEQRKSRSGGVYSGQRIKICNEHRINTLISPIHAVILGFLKKVKRRLLSIRELAEKGQSEAIDDQNKLVGAIGKQPWIYDKGKVQKYGELLKEFDKYEHMLTWMIGQPFWKGCESISCSFFSISPETFSGNSCYKRIYMEMRSFMQKHFWWTPLEDTTGLIAMLRRKTDKDGDNGLQRKYSILYEYWCFWRLIHAFETYGFDFSNARQSLRKNLARTLFVEPERLSMEPAESNDYEIRLIHDFRAFRKSSNMETKFFISEGSDSLLSPDFAFKITNKKSKKWFWMLMDAKSTEMLSKGQIEQRDKYLTRISYRENETSSINPEQAWLFYAGGESPGIEGCDDDNEDAYSWTTNLNKDICFGENWDFSCQAQTGIIKRALNKDIRFRGHVRANAISCPLPEHDQINEDDPFVKFAKIQMETAKNYLGGVSLEDN